MLNYTVQMQIACWSKRPRLSQKMVNVQGDRIPFIILSRQFLKFPSMRWFTITATLEGRHHVSNENQESKQELFNLRKKPYIPKTCRKEGTNRNYTCRVSANTNRHDKLRCRMK